MYLKKNSQRLNVMLVLLIALLFMSLTKPLYAQTEATNMSTNLENDIAVLTALNQNYLISYRTGDSEWFDDNLTEDFRETAPDGTILDKEAFLQKIRTRAGGDDQGVSAGELEIRLFGDLAIVHAYPVTPLPGGEVQKGGRYTDVYYKVSGRWLCVTAHLGGTQTN